MSEYSAEAKEAARELRAKIIKDIQDGKYVTRVADLELQNGKKL